MNSLTGIVVRFGPIALQLLHTGVRYGNDGNPFTCALILVETVKNPPDASRRGRGIHIQVLGVSLILGWISHEEALPPGPPASRSS